MIYADPMLTLISAGQSGIYCHIGERQVADVFAGQTGCEFKNDKYAGKRPRDRHSSNTHLSICQGCFLSHPERERSIWP